jgi:hypothetical protein
MDSFTIRLGLPAAVCRQSENKQLDPLFILTSGSVGVSGGCLVGIHLSRRLHLPPRLHYV